MRHALSAFIAAVLVAPPASMAAAQTTDADFVHKASVADIFAIESSQLALQRTQNPAIRDYAQKVIDDDTRAAADLQAALNSDKASVQPDAMLDSARQADMDALTHATADGFDRLYVELQTHVHEDAVTLFNDYVTTGKAPAMQGFAHDALPVLQAHLAQAQTLATATGG